MSVGASFSTPPVIGHIPGLDGIRALAIGLVLLSHTVLHNEFMDLRPLMAAGSAGVTVFFVLSGYLITSLLLREEDRTGEISLRLFYLRRAIRLFPALWLYLLVVGAIWLSGRLPDHPWYSFVSSLFYVRNLVGRGHETGHLWSLSLEEQFYLIWPLVFVGLSRRNGARLVAAVTGLVGITIWRIYAVKNQLFSDGRLYMRSDFRFDGPLFGCALALLAHVAPQPGRWLISAGWRSSLLAVIGAAGLAAWVGLRLDEDVYPGTDSTVVCLLGMVLIISQIGVQGIGSRWLAWPLLVVIGKMSYGVYLWQQLFLGPPIPGLERIRTFPVNLIATFAVAAVSYSCLERPLLRLKDRKLHHDRMPGDENPANGNRSSEERRLAEPIASGPPPRIAGSELLDTQGLG
jgi:peptidoglycan/LPS O-acetylase OafA/YrhL